MTLTREQALSVLIEAAESWARELTDYIIPADENNEEMEDTNDNRRQMVDDIYEAAKLLGGGTDGQEKATPGH